MYHGKIFKNMEEKTLKVFYCLKSLIQGEIQVGNSRKICNQMVIGYKQLCEIVFERYNLYIQYHLELGELLGIIANVAAKQNLPILSSNIMPLKQKIPSVGYYRMAVSNNLYCDDGQLDISKQSLLSKEVLQKRSAFVNKQLEQRSSLTENDFQVIEENLKIELARIVNKKD